MPEQLTLSNLKPAQPRKNRKRVGRGLGSGKGRYAGRGIKGQKSRSGSHKMPVTFEGGQVPLQRRVGKLRGTSLKAMPTERFRTQTVPVNVRDLERCFAAGDVVTPEALVEKRLIKNTKIDVKVLATGDLSKQLTVRLHAASSAAREKIEGAGGTVELLRPPRVPKPRRTKKASPVTD